jgi:hypothetical protein
MSAQCHPENRSGISKMDSSTDAKPESDYAEACKDRMSRNCIIDSQSVLLEGSTA